MRCYAPRFETSGIINQVDSFRLDDAGSNYAFKKFEGKTVLRTTFIIGKDYSGEELPRGTTEVHEYRMVDDTIPNSFLYFGQVIRYVRYTFDKKGNEELEGYDHEGYANLKVIYSEERRKVPLILSTIKLEEFKPGEEKNLEVMLNIKDHRFLRQPTDDLELLQTLD